MEDTVPVSSEQALGGLMHDADFTQQRQRRPARRHDLLKVFALQVLHHEVRRSGLLAVLVKRHDVWMMQVTSSAGLVLKACECVGSDVRQELDSDWARDSRIECFVDPSEAARAEQGIYPVPPDRTGHPRHLDNYIPGPSEPDTAEGGEDDPALQVFSRGVVSSAVR